MAAALVNGKFDVQLASRGAFAYLGKHAYLAQNEKAEFWRRTVDGIRYHNPLGFESKEFHGTDGAIVFQSPLGRTLVFAPNGRAYMGQMDYLHDAWQANYKNLKEIKSENPIRVRPKL